MAVRVYGKRSTPLCRCSEGRHSLGPRSCSSNHPRNLFDSDIPQDIAADCVQETAADLDVTSWSWSRLLRRDFVAGFAAGFALLRGGQGSSVHP